MSDPLIAPVQRDALFVARHAVVEFGADVRRAARALPDGDDLSWRAPAQRAYAGRLHELSCEVRAAEAHLASALAAIDEAIAAVGS